MGGKEKFKNEFTHRLICFSLDMIKFSEDLKQDKVFWSLIDQLIRSSTSIGANVVEAKSSSSRKEYIKYFQIALKSANETKYWLFIIKEGYPDKGARAQNFLNEVIEIANILATSVLTLKNKNK